MNFPIQPVPVPRATRPLEPPPFKDPSDIILAAAHLQQQNQMMQQRQAENLSNTMMAASSLLEKRRENEAAMAQQQALLDLQQRMQGPKMEEIKATVGKLQAEAAEKQSQANLNNLFTQTGAVHPSQTYGPTEKVDASKPPKEVPPAMWDYMVKAHQGEASYGALRYARGPLGQAAPFMQLLHAKYFPNDDLNAIEGAAAGAKAQASATGSLVGGPVERAVRAEGIIQGTLSNMKSIIPRLTTGQLSLFNRVQLGLQQDTGDRDVNLLNSFASDAMKEMPQLFPGNTGSDLQATQSMHMLNQAKSPQQLMDSVNQIQMTAHDRSRAWQKLPTAVELIRQNSENKKSAQKALQDAGYQF